MAIRLPRLRSGQSARRVRDLYRKVPGGLRLRVRVAGLIDRILRLGKRRAPRLYAIARDAYRTLRPRKPAAGESARSCYEAISKLNIIDNVAKVTAAFHERLGLDPQQSPVGRCLAGMRAELAAEVEALGTISARSPLERFELAWRAYAAGRTGEALQEFGAVIADERLAGAIASDPRSREAFIRSAEILGQHAELCGDSGAAADLYRRILEHDGNGIVARRLVLMLWREGRMREAAGYAPRVMQSDSNLAQHVRRSDAVGELTRRLQCEARRISQEGLGKRTGAIMAISPLVVAWLSNLTSREVLRGGAVLEMGPSDLILYTPAAIEFYLRRHVPRDRVGAMMARMFDGQGQFRREEIGTLYKVFGYTKYRSIDLADTRAEVAPVDRTDFPLR